MAEIPLNQPAQSGNVLPVPTNGTGGSFSISCSTTISAPALACLGIVLNTTTYPSWNTFCPQVTIDVAPSPTTPSSASGDDSAELEQFANRPDHLYPGVQMSFYVQMTPGAGTSNTTRLEVTVLEEFETKDGRTGYRIAWKMLGMPYYLLRAERVQEFVETKQEGDNSPAVVTEYRCWETFGGLLSYLMPGSVVSQVVGGFDRWANGLKEEAEKAAKGSS